MTENVIELREGEKKIFEVRKSWTAILGLGMMGLALAVIPLIILFVLPSRFIAIDNEIFRNVVRLGGYIYTLFVCSFLFVAWLDFYMDVMIVTSERMIVVNQINLFSRQISELHLEEIQDATSRTPGFIGALFNFGTVEVQTAGLRENFIFHHIVNPHLVARRIMQIRREREMGAREGQTEKLAGAIRESVQENRKRLGEILLEEDLLTREQLNKALGQQERLGGRLGTHLINLGYITGQDLLASLGQQARVPAIDVSRYAFNPEILKLIPANVAKKFQVIPISKMGNVLTVAMADPNDSFIVKELAHLTGMEISPVISAEKYIREAIQKHYQLIVDRGRIIDEADGIFWQGGEEMPPDVGEILKEMDGGKE